MVNLNSQINASECEHCMTMNRDEKADGVRDMYYPRVLYLRVRARDIYAVTPRMSLTTRINNFSPRYDDVLCNLTMAMC